MNTLTIRLLPAALAAASIAAAALLVAPSEAAVVPAPVVLMPTVNVLASRDALRTEVVELPMVTVIGQRPLGAPTRVAQRTAQPRS